MIRRNVNDEAPTRREELASVRSLRPAPLIRRRIRELGLQGRPVLGWTPPVVSLRRCR